MHKLPSGNYAHGISRKSLGRRFSFSLRTKSYREAKRRAAALNSLADAREIELLERVSCGELPIEELIEALAPGGPGLEPLRRKPAFISLRTAGEALLRELSHSPTNTQRAARVVLRQLERAFGAERSLSSVSFAEAQRWLRGSGWSRRSQSQKRAYASRVWEMGRLLSSAPFLNPWALLEPVGRDRAKSRGFLTLEQTHELLDRIESPRDAAFLACGFLGTMRIGEVAQLKWSDIDYHAGTISIVATDEWHPKTTLSKRIIQMPDKLYLLLRLWQGQAHCGPYVFGAEAPLPERTASRWARKALAKAGYPQLTFHSGRHSAITNMIAAGASVPEVVEQAGVSARTLLETYAHVLSSRRAKLGSLLDLTEKTTEGTDTNGES